MTYQSHSPVYSASSAVYALDNFSFYNCMTPNSNDIIYSAQFKHTPYNKTNYISNYTKSEHIHTETFFNPDIFCKDHSTQPFINTESEIEEFVKKAFSALLKRPFEENIQIEICSNDKFKTLVSDPGVLGFSVNKRHTSQPSKIVVKKDRLDRLMLTIGHEIGHVISDPLENRIDEEAKAFAFSFAWMKKIRELNIANLRYSIAPFSPALNGIHNKAHSQVLNKLFNGQSEISLFYQLASKNLIVSS